VTFLCRITNALWRSVWRISQRDSELSAWGFIRNLRGSLTLALVFLLHYRTAFDVIETPEWGATGAFLHLLARRSLRVVKCHASDYSHAINYRPYFRVARADVACANMLERLSLNHAHAVLSPSRALLADIRDNLGFTRTVLVVPNEINPEVCTHLKEQALKITAHAAPGNRPFTVFSSGRLDQLKGLDTIQKVLSTLSQRAGASKRFVFAGDASPAVAHELSSFRSGSLEVALLGAVSQQAVFENLLMSDVFFFPSWTENCPMAVLEAMALGIPVVASNVGGIPELIQQNQTGLLCGRDQPQEFVDQIERLQNEPELRRRLAQNGRDAVAGKFASPVPTREWLDIVEGARHSAGPDND
jgi:glycosyltransferase involved in cell wall biosynthesis